ncbi:M20/M25/M40 family metallo-hydrolase [Cellulomonas chengniuliangii]|uniref:M20/M25/M40 family metallo-hydrolase n=1 Tax=Cellulomonas chengniuliangii TaxID=2968084 RepID=A0ABY5L425_9CELL|nr:M20/M25/M40 family metallo-hydrolase [Cellulomonas chengniuliangii]MCC2308160.1 M20/M25/M40 family metallo-hydrolase [Cellulomonas chengniuliangii]MCC2317167.1 M20/M25/M40 family metallo-hydrolase [Cellulomonas chengniuliangii]UUI76554.1 M20/M25/M40 family metallo-hydrolase [Cellulomonas chengniuliangii]
MSAGEDRASTTAPVGAPAAPSGHPTAEDEVVRICQELIRIDTSNYGDGTGPGERAAAEYVMGLLTEVGLSPEYFESEPGRANVVVRLEGRDRERPALVLHGHLDVVPAQASDWSVDPFSGEEKDGLIWGRGAVDMKDMDAMMLAVVRQMAREGRKPARDVVLAFFADEEAGGVHGARWAVDNRPDLFEGATEAISEVGGFSVEVDGRRAYLLQTAEKGIGWLRLVADGRAGHGSQVNHDNAVTHLAAAVARIGQHPWPLALTPTVERLLRGVADLTGLPFDPHDPQTVDRLVHALGPASRFVGATLRNTANPTQLSAGYKANVIPGRAEAVIDGRFLPGHESQLMSTLHELAGPEVRIEVLHRDVALEVPFEGELVDAMAAALLAEDPGAAVLPYTLSGGTDNKSLSVLGITGYGFAPLRLPGAMDFSAMFHGVDERVPTDALRFGVRVLDRLLQTA